MKNTEDYKYNKHCYTNQEFISKVLNKCEWIDSILDEYTPGLKEIRVKSKYCGHICLVTCKSLTRERSVKKCPKCRTEKEKRFCKNCGKELKSGQTKFCSSSCSAKYYGKLKSETIKKNKCLNCNKDIPLQRKFCSRDCLNSFYQKQREKEVYSNIKTKDGRVSKTVRKFLFKKYNNSCQLCGWSTKNEFTGKVPLQIHHIDGNPENNNIENLQLLCPNCHSLTKSYSNKNYGKGRESRRIRRLKNNTNN